jgi:H+/Cl- antiporter ClcA
VRRVSTAGIFLMMEVPYILNIHVSALLPYLMAAYLSDATARMLGTTHQTD